MASFFLYFPVKSTCFTIANFQLDKYPWNPNFLNSTNLEQEPLTIPNQMIENLSFKLLYDAINTLF